MNDLTTRYFSFWADRHYKVRIIRANLEQSDCTDGGAYDWHLAAYCEHLEKTMFPGSRIIYSWGADHEPTSGTVLDKDTAEYLEWCEQTEQDYCVL